MNSLITRLKDEQASLVDAIDAITEEAAKQNRSELNETEDKNLADLQAKLEDVSKRLNQLVDIELRKAEATEKMALLDVDAKQERKVTVKSDDPIYREDSQHSWMRDIMAAHRGDFDARDRLQRNNAQVMQSRAVSSSSGADGFIPPVYLTSKYADVIRGGRPVANLVPAQGAPNAMTLHIPKITTGTSVDWQSSENTAFATQDTVFGDVTVNTLTIGGYVPVSVQALEFSDPSYQAVAFNDLARAYAEAVEAAVINKNSTGFKGILKESSTASVDIGTAALTGGKLYRKIGEAVNAVSTNAKTDPDVIVMSPSLFNWFALEVDTTGRPLLTRYQPQNALGAIAGTNPDGYRGELHGVPVVASYGIPRVTDGSTPSVTDSVIVAKMADMALWESGLTAVVDTQSGATAGKVNLVLRAYVAFTCARRPQSIAVVEGHAFQAGYTF